MPYPREPVLGKLAVQFVHDAVPRDFAMMLAAAIDWERQSPLMMRHWGIGSWDLEPVDQKVVGRVMVHGAVHGCNSPADAHPVDFAGRNHGT